MTPARALFLAQCAQGAKNPEWWGDAERERCEAQVQAVLAAAPLAGGARERIKTILDEETTVGGTSAYRSGAVNSDELAGLILAALSPEAPARETEGGAVILKGVGRIDGDGWKDTTRKGEVVFVWNAEKPSPYASGQYPRIGNEGWSASTSQYDFAPATVQEVRDLFASLTPRHEAPAEGAGEDVNWKAEYEAVCEARITDRQKSQEIINERDKWIVELIRESDALRARSSAPEAREDYSSLIAARCVALPGKLTNCPVCLAVDNERDRQAAPSADKLRTAVEALRTPGDDAECAAYNSALDDLYEALK